ncbi:MAG: hypothetical protein ACI9D4_002489, partial [Polaribacter sp.]
NLADFLKKTSSSCISKVLAFRMNKDVCFLEID